jgi:hypothetical protein
MQWVVGISPSTGKFADRSKGHVVRVNCPEPPFRGKEESINDDQPKRSSASSDQDATPPLATNYRIIVLAKA